MQSTSVPLREEVDLVRGRLPAEDFIAVGKASESLDDVDVRVPITT
jgi:hypothetical protein